MARGAVAPVMAQHATCTSASVRLHRIGYATLALAVVACAGFANAQTPAHAAFALEETTIAEVHRAFDNGTLTCRTLVQGYLDRIERYNASGPRLNAVQHVHPRALLIADSLDTSAKQGDERRALHCVPVLLKDQVETQSMPTTYGSAAFRNFVPERDATIVSRLEAAGAIILGKATMGELAGRYVSSLSGIIRNAYDPARNPSGSSSGTGSGIAANFALVGIGEDTGGSIRGPAAVSSLVGLRPTFGLVSRFGMMPANPTQDVLGPMTRTVMDAALLLDVIAGFDPADPVTAYGVGHLPDSYATGLHANALRGRRVGVLRTTRDSIADSVRADFAEVALILDAALDTLRALGADVHDSLVIPELTALRRVGNVYETEEATDRYLAQHPGAPVKSLQELLLTGTVNPWRARSLIGYVGRRTTEAGYLTVMQRREALRVAVLSTMAAHKLDAIVYATYDASATLIAPDVLTNPRPADGYGLGDNRGLSPLVGFPALTVPAGFTTQGLPVGLELLGRPFSEPALLRFAYAFEQTTHHRRAPTTVPPLRARK